MFTFHLHYRKKLAVSSYHEGRFSLRKLYSTLFTKVQDGSEKTITENPEHFN